MNGFNFGNGSREHQEARDVNQMKKHEYKDNLAESKENNAETVYLGSEEEMLKNAIGTILNIITNNKKQLSQMTEDRDNKVEQLRQMMKDRDDKVEQIRQMTEDRDNKVEQLRQMTEDRDNKVEQLRLMMEDRDNKVEQLRQMTEDRDVKVEQLRQMTEDRDDKIEQLRQMTEDRDVKIEQLRQMTEDRDVKVEQLRQMTEDRDDKVEQLRQMTDDRNEKVNRIELLMGEKNEFYSIADKYIRIAKISLKCESFKDIFAKLDIEDLESISNQVKFITSFGNGFDFARSIYLSMKEYKEKNPSVISEQELEVICAINDFYKENYGESFKNFDALDCLGICNASVKFDRKAMSIINDPRNTSIGSVSKLYVPMLRMQNGKDIEKKAIVGE